MGSCLLWIVKVLLVVVWNEYYVVLLVLQVLASYGSLPVLFSWIRWPFSLHRNINSRGIWTCKWNVVLKIHFRQHYWYHLQKWNSKCPSWKVTVKLKIIKNVINESVGLNKVWKKSEKEFKKSERGVTTAATDNSTYYLDTTNIAS